jgi:hypothetical protein
MCKYVHICDSVEIVCGVKLPPNNVARETFLHKSGAARIIDWIFITGVTAWQRLGEYVTLDTNFYSLLFK